MNLEPHQHYESRDHGYLHCAFNAEHFHARNSESFLCVWVVLQEFGTALSLKVREDGSNAAHAYSAVNIDPS
jgi:hypothetical protein